MAEWSSQADIGLRFVLFILSLLFLDPSLATESGTSVQRPYRVDGNLVVPNHRPAAEAVYRSQPVCFGTIPYYAIEWPERVLRGRNPEEVYPSLRSLCTLYIHGGVPLDNAATYCAYNARAGPFIVFGDHPGIGLWQSPDEQRFWVAVILMCKIRCRCQKKSRAEFDPDYEFSLPAPEVAEIETDPSYFLLSDVPKLYSPKERHRPSIRIQIRAASMMLMMYDPNYYIETFAISPGYTMEPPDCKSQLPPFSLPSPFRANDVHDGTGLCAAHWFYGSFKGNLGGYCSNVSEVFEYSVASAHPALNNAARSEHAPQSRHSYALQAWCETACGCFGRKPSTSILMKDTDGIVKGWVAQFGASGMWATHEASNGHTIGIWIYDTAWETSTFDENPQQRPGSCEEAVGGSCSTASLDQLKSAQFGVQSSTSSSATPIPRYTKGLQYTLTRQRSHIPYPQPSCGGTCSSWRDCGSSLSNGCKCVVDLAKNMASVSTLSAVFVATCLPGYAKSITSPGQPAGLGGRDVNTEWACPCNATYVSKGCCESKSGVVWEDTALKLGELV